MNLKLTLREQAIKALQHIISVFNPNVKWYEESVTDNEVEDKINLYKYYTLRFKRQIEINKELIELTKAQRPEKREQQLYNEYEIIDRELLIGDLEVKIAAYSSYVKVYSNMMALWEYNQKQLAIDLEKNGAETERKISEMLNRDIPDEKKNEVRGLLNQYYSSQNRIEAFQRMKDFLRQNYKA